MIELPLFLKLRSTLSVALIFVIFSGSAQCPDSFVFFSQAALNEFALNYPNCTAANIVVLKHPNTGWSIFDTDIEDLSPLSNIQSFQSIIINGNPLLTNLEGLNGLTMQGIGQIRIENNTNLEDISALGNIIGQVGLLHIENNQSLMSLTGLHNVISTTNEVTIRKNPGLASLQV